MKQLESEAAGLLHNIIEEVYRVDAMRNSRMQLAQVTFRRTECKPREDGSLGSNNQYWYDCRDLSQLTPIFPHNKKVQPTLNNRKAGMN